MGTLPGVRTVFLGTSEFAVAVLERLARSEHRPLLVVTRPDRPRGRGRKVSPPPVAEAARGLGIDLLQAERVNSEEARRRIASVEPEAVCIAAFGGLIKEPLLSAHPDDGPPITRVHGRSTPYRRKKSTVGGYGSRWSAGESEFLPTTRC